MKRETFKNRSEKFSTELGIHLLLMVVVFICLFPLFWMFGSALKTQSTVFTDMSLFPSNPQWRNFYLAWTEGNFSTYFFNSVLYTTTVVVSILAISSLAAFAFARLKFPGKNILFFMFLATMMIPVPGSFIALYVLLDKLGLVNTRLGYILPQINAGLALGIFLLKTFFEDMPKDLEDAAEIDGCSKLGIYWHMALPLAKPGLAVVAIFSALTVWNEYILAMLILQDKNLMPLQRGLMVFQGSYVTNYPLLMAGVTLTVVPILIIYLVMQKHIISGITAGALKG